MTMPHNHTIAVHQECVQATAMETTVLEESLPNVPSLHIMSQPGEPTGAQPRNPLSPRGIAFLQDSGPQERKSPLQRQDRAHTVWPWNRRRSGSTAGSPGARSFPGSLRTRSEVASPPSNAMAPPVAAAVSSDGSPSSTPQSPSLSFDGCGTPHQLSPLCSETFRAFHSPSPRSPLQPTNSCKYVVLLCATRYGRAGISSVL